MRRAHPVWIGTLLALALLSGSCTGGQNGPGPRAPAEATPSPEIVPPGATTAPPVFEEGDAVLDVAIPEPSSLDPMRLQDPGSLLVARQLYEGLTRWDPAREVVVPAVAEDWSVADGGRTFLFRLRQGMSFHDGTPVTSKTFKFAFERIAMRGNASDLAYTLESVEGFDAVNQQGTTNRLSGLATPDPLSLVVRLSEPFYDFPAVLTHPGLVPLPPRAVSNIDEFLASPTGNGPFQVAEPWSPGQPVILEAFPGFIETPDLDGIRFLPYPDAAASWLPFRRGELDVAEVPAGQIGEARERFGEAGFQPFLAAYYYGLNLRSPQLARERVRAAVNWAIDRAAIGRTIYKGSMEPSRGIVPRGMPGFQEDICLPQCRYSPEKAAAIVGKLPKKARRLRIQISRGAPHGQVARFVKGDLVEVGFKVKVSSFRFGEYLKHLRRGRQDVYRFGWIAEYPVTDAFLSALFESDSPDNYSGFSSSKVDGLLAEARAEPSKGRRLALYAQAEKTILRRLPIVPIGSFVTHWAAQPAVRGMRFDVMGGFDATHIFLEED